MPVTLGLGLFTGQVPPGGARTVADEYRDMLELARLGEGAGFGSLWVSEHHGAADGYLPSLAVALGAMAAVTRRARLGMGVALAPFPDAADVAPGHHARLAGARHRLPAHRRRGRHRAAGRLPHRGRGPDPVHPLDQILQAYDRCGQPKRLHLLPEKGLDLLFDPGWTRRRSHRRRAGP
jgi:hypothetical protein